MAIRWLWLRAAIRWLWVGSVSWFRVSVGGCWVSIGGLRVAIGWCGVGHICGFWVGHIGRFWVCNICWLGVAIGRSGMAIVGSRVAIVRTYVMADKKTIVNIAGTMKDRRNTKPSESK